MKLYYYHDDYPNFGDDLNSWIWLHLLPDFFDDNSDELFLGIGTILNNALPLAGKYVVFGSGYGYGDKPDIDDNWEIICVRGFKTCDILGISRKKAIIDPAYLLKTLLTTKEEKKYLISIIPHALSMNLGDWQRVADILGANLIDARTTNIENFVRQIKQSEKIICEAMHGAIIADCFGIPWCGYRAYKWINNDKWNDWLSVFRCEYSLHEVDTLVYKHKSIRDMLKNRLKQLLDKTRWWNDKWAKPLYGNAPEQVAAELRHILVEAEFSYSSPSDIDDKIAQLQEKLTKLKEKKQQ